MNDTVLATMWLQSKRDCINHNAKPQYTPIDEIIELTDWSTVCIAAVPRLCAV
jgi:hypothetical protein